MGCGAVHSARTHPAPPPKLEKVVPAPSSSGPVELTWEEKQGTTTVDTDAETKLPPNEADEQQGDAEQEDDEEDEEDDDESDDSYPGEPPEARWARMARREKKLARQKRKAAKAAREGKSLPSAPPSSIDCFRGMWRPNAKPDKEGCFDRQCFLTHNRAALDEMYELSITLGKGTYGSVSRCTHRRTRALYALKSMPKKKVYNPSRLGQEVEIMRILEHPNITKLHETFEDAKYIYIIMELCTGGELFERIMKEGQSFQGFSEAAVVKMMRQIAGAIYYMHLQRVAHRDLKPENFLLVREVENLEEAHLKVIDFGFSTRFEPGVYMTTMACTNHYVAPEVLDGKYTEACDVWSLGVVIYMLLCGSAPFYGSNEAQILDKVRACAYDFEPDAWGKVSEDSKDLIKHILVVDPQARHTAQNVLQHRWIERTAPQASKSPLSQAALNQLKSFHALGKFRKAALTMVAQQLPEASICELRQIFEALDEDGDGSLSSEELQRAFRYAGMEMPEALRPIFDQVDSDGSGMVEYTEFLSAALDQKHQQQEGACWAAFCVLDRNGDGKISKDEIAVLLRGDVMATFKATVGIDHTEIEKVVADADQDNDEMLDFNEFLDLLQKACQRKSIKGDVSPGLPGGVEGAGSEELL